MIIQREYMEKIQFKIFMISTFLRITFLICLLMTQNIIIVEICFKQILNQMKLIYYKEQIVRIVYRMQLKLGYTQMLGQEGKKKVKKSYRKFKWQHPIRKYLEMHFVRVIQERSLSIAMELLIRVIHPIQFPSLVIIGCHGQA